MGTYKWMLRRGGKKERCPQCGRMRFVPFVLTADGKTKAGEAYGRCDREVSCGYFRYPDKPIDTGAVFVHRVEATKKEPILFPREMMVNNSFNRRNASLCRAYEALIPLSRLDGALDNYLIGVGTHGETIYFQFDGQHVRTAKAILYGKDGHRVKVEDGGLPVWWLHKSPTVTKYTAGKELKQCFFGQHLLKQYPNAKVYVVEAEKTAVLMAATDTKTMDVRIWLACGGSQMLKGAIDLMPLIGRDVVVIPDHGQFWNWKRTADAYGWRCIDISPLQLRHNMPDGFDIWDITEDLIRTNRQPYEV